MATAGLVRITFVLVVIHSIAPATAHAQSRDDNWFQQLAGWSAGPIVANQATRRLEVRKIDSNDEAWIEVTTTVDAVRGFSYRVDHAGGSPSLRQKMLKALEEEGRTWNSREQKRTALNVVNYELAVDEMRSDEVEIGLTPKRKDELLIAGHAVLSRPAGELLRIEGRLVKPPSFWLKEVTITRSYARVGRHVMPIRLDSQLRVRWLGDYVFLMTYNYEVVDGVEVAQLARR